MSYQVLARKWRPKHFTEMVGQGHVLKALVNALDDNRLHHAYLFTGTRGVGKTSIARLFAKALNCEQGVSSKPCGVCSSCEEIAEGRFVDLIEVDAASRTKVEDTRELLENVQYAPSRGRFKVYLIDEVHMLSKSSFNALLKTLEEPPPHVKFLLATTDPQKLPVTVLSRCLQFNLKNMIPQRIVEHLKTVLNAENISFDEEALWLLARSADGSMRDALSLTDQSIAFGAGSISEPDVRVMLGTIDLKLVYQIIQSLVNVDGAALLQCVDDLAQFSPDYYSVLGDVVSLLHRIAIAQTVPAALNNSMGDREQVLALAGQLSAEDVQLYYQVALMGRKDLPLVPDAREGLEMTLMRMLAFRPAGAKPPSSEFVLPDKGEAANETADQLKTTSHIASGSSEKDLVHTSVAEESSADELSCTSAIEAVESPRGSQRDEQANSVDPVKSKSSHEPGESARRLEQSDEVIPEPGMEQNTNDRQEVLQTVVLDESASLAQVSTAQLTVDRSEPIEDLSSDAKTEQDKASVEVTKAQEAPVVNSEVAVDVPPWEDESEGHSAQSAVSVELDKNAVHTQEHAALSKSSSEAVSEKGGYQIDISELLDEPVAAFDEINLECWPSLVGAIGFTGMTAHIAENLSLEEITGDELVFNVSKVQQNVLDETQKGRIHTLLSQYFDRSLTVRFDAQQSTRETPWQCFEKLRAKKLRLAIEHFNQDSVVQQIVATFAGYIDRSSIMPTR